ncbi:hypothetical protein FNAPI_9491 [Fusarium napiforme]|uniref:Uncharacterized protein n=1 Tax=Fusarium napiforme TaxID=42672 RepID=A0A8H5IWU4_9HYPO|nr:hypothetical protein FNAPI_9491 [Fusarium napiforme]
MHLFNFLLFLLSLVKATPVTLESSSLEGFLDFEDEGSLPVVDDPDFLDLGTRNTDTQNHHEKRSGPPYNLTYTLWKVTFERRMGDGWDFKEPGWIFHYPAMYPLQKKDQPVDKPNPWDIVVTAGRSIPMPIGGANDGALWYTSNSYFEPLLTHSRPTARTFTQYTWANMVGGRTTFNIYRTKYDKLAKGNTGASWVFKNTVDKPITGFITVDFSSRSNVTGVVAFRSLTTSYNANITGSFFQRGTMLA